MFPYVVSCQCSISVVSLLKVPDAYPWVYKGLFDEVLRHNAYSIDSTFAVEIKIGLILCQRNMFNCQY